MDYAASKTEEAHARLDGVISRIPTYTPALVLKAQWLTAENKLDEALERAQAAVTSNPDVGDGAFRPRLGAGAAA